MKAYQKVYNLVRKIPKGKVATYGQIGYILNLDPRIVGWALNKLAPTSPRTYEPRKNNHGLKVPWQRVINSKGKVSTNKVLNIPLGLQKRLLEKEGIKFDKDAKVNLKKYLYKFSWYQTNYFHF